MAAFASIGQPGSAKHVRAFTAFSEAQLEKRRTDDYPTALAHGDINDEWVDAESVTGVMSASMLGDRTPLHGNDDRRTDTAALARTHASRKQSD
jgi:hypothetical protein